MDGWWGFVCMQCFNPWWTTYLLSIIILVSQSKFSPIFSLFSFSLIACLFLCVLIVFGADKEAGTEKYELNIQSTADCIWLLCCSTHPHIHGSGLQGPDGKGDSSGLCDKHHVFTRLFSTHDALLYWSLFVYLRWGTLLDMHSFEALPFH